MKEFYMKYLKDKCSEFSFKISIGVRYQNLSLRVRG